MGVGHSRTKGSVRRAGRKRKKVRGGKSGTKKGVARQGGATKEGNGFEAMQGQRK